MIRGGRAAALAATILASGAAAAQPGARPPAAQAAAAPPAGAPAAAAISFDEAVRRATEHATLSLVAAQEIERAEGLLAQARSGSLPLVSATGTVTRLSGFGTNIVAAPHQQSANVTVSIPVIAASRWYQWAHASDAVGVARASELDVRRTAAITAARAYLSVVAQKRAVEVSQRAVDTARTHSTFAHTRRAGGVGNALDEARADQQLATSEAQVESALTGLARAREALAVATGSEGPLDAAAEPELRMQPEPEAEAQRDAERTRADVRAARVRAGAADRVARDSWADWLPTLLANVQPVLYQHPGTAFVPEGGWQAQLVLSVPLFEGGLRPGQARERAALAAEAQVQLDGLLLQARSEVRSAVASLQHAESAFAQSRRAADQAGVALQLVTTAYRAGATTSLDVTDAERQARDADTAAVVSEDAVRQARLDLLAATGHFP